MRAPSVNSFDDARIAAEVIAKLTADSPSNFLNINVKSESGIVTLSGTVDSADKRARAAQIASAVNGVKGLVSNIQLASSLVAEHRRRRRPTCRRRRSERPRSTRPARLRPSQLVLTDGTVVRVPTSAGVHRGSQRLALTQIEPGAEVVVQLAPMPAASASTTAPSPGPTQTTPVPTSPTPRTPSATTNVFDASDVSIVWTPSASANR
jgi:BON domain-containing protein